MNEKEFDGRTALVTGAGRGIGRAVARLLAEAGATVVAVDRDADAVHRLADELSAAGAGGLALPADVADAAEVERIVEAAEREAGPLDLLVNVAGVLRTGPALDLTDEDWRAMFAVNTDGVFHCSRAVARRMVPRRRGAIVTVASNAARVPRALMTGYAASKAASAAFTKSLAVELAPYGIRCNVVNPGSTDTPMLRGMWSGGGDARSTVAGDPDRFKVGIPLGKLAQPSDVAEAVAFLLSDRAGHITMHELCVDGGASLGA
ncbi:2,3-dihydro-2,3-dihydroxybenzoate dehydrogenase [Kitasatospora sp. MBT63]|uniref:2,3-dihydro-2,3-dihydroxybenzoate dehydrogenase n=1 Tax=Kitasatospora sp. MBT63 TaxID=1444768 RepID=UPI000539B96D|nr:2,3-dihydro-2,3-dihydroxybenzoate dehydrogenase [Kitasatospora sp. MBT63]